MHKVWPDNLLLERMYLLDTKPVLAFRCHLYIGDS